MPLNGYKDRHSKIKKCQRNISINLNGIKNIFNYAFREIKKITLWKLYLYYSKFGRMKLMLFARYKKMQSISLKLFRKVKDFKKYGKLW